MKPNRVLAVVVGCVAVLAVVALLVEASRPEITFDPATPEGTVQRYLRAVLVGDNEAAYGYMAEESECQPHDFRSAVAEHSARAVLRDVSVEGDIAEAEVELTFTGGGGPFDGYERSERRVFVLVREGGGWAITGEPWPLVFCGRR